MGNYVTRDDFEWSSQEEPHAKRRVEILSMFMKRNTEAKLSKQLLHVMFLKAQGIHSC